MASSICVAGKNLVKKIDEIKDIIIAADWAISLLLFYNILLHIIIHAQGDNAEALKNIFPFLKRELC